MSQLHQMLQSAQQVPFTLPQSQKLESLRLNELEMRRKFHIDLSNNTFTPNWLTPEIAEDLRGSTDAYHILEGEFQVRSYGYFTRFNCQCIAFVMHHVLRFLLFP